MLFQKVKDRDSSKHGAARRVQINVKGLHFLDNAHCVLERLFVEAIFPPTAADNSEKVKACGLRFVGLRRYFIEKIIRHLFHPACLDL